MQIRNLIFVEIGTVATTASSVVPGWDDLGVWRWVAIGATVVLMGTLAAQDRSARKLEPKVVPFEPQEWLPDGTLRQGAMLTIPHSTHRRSHPVVDVFEQNEDGGMEAVIVDVTVDHATHDIKLVMLSGDPLPAKGFKGVAVVR